VSVHSCGPRPLTEAAPALLKVRKRSGNLSEI
jgi:hypothetical protein